MPNIVRRAFGLPIVIIYVASIAATTGLLLNFVPSSRTPLEIVKDLESTADGLPVSVGSPDVLKDVSSESEADKIDRLRRAFLGQPIASASEEQFRTVDDNRLWHAAEELAPEGIEFASSPLYVATPYTPLFEALAVKVSPGSSVTFVSYDSGYFASGYHTITVKADAEGNARAAFFVRDPGLYRIMATSPQHPGRVRFTIWATSETAP